MKSYIFMILTSILFGILGVTIKLLGPSIPAMTLPFYRIAIAFLALVFIVPKLDKNFYKITKKDAIDFFMIGALLATSICLFTTSLLFTTVQNATILGHISPIFIMIFAYFILNEKITKTKIVTLFLAILGVFIMHPFNSNQSEFGNMLALLGSITFAIAVIGMRKEDKTHSIGDVLWFFFYATLILSPLPFIYGFGDLTMNVLGLLILLGLFGTALPFLFYNFALEKMEAEIASIINLLITPIVSIILAIIIISEPLNPNSIIGGAILIISGIYIQLHRKELKMQD